MAKANVLIDNDKVKVTKWLFDVGDSTGHHIHENHQEKLGQSGLKILILQT